MTSTSHNHQKKIAVINDFSGFGRCSIAVALPVISTCFSTFSLTSAIPTLPIPSVM